MIFHEGRYVALGRAEQIDASLLHDGESAEVVDQRGRILTHSGQVAGVVGTSYGPEVSVRFHFEGASPPGPLVEVRVFPNGPDDSVLAIPAGALVQLPEGLAVFVARAKGVYERRFVITDEHRSGVTIVHQGLDRPVAVATEHIERLVRAARDSMLTPRSAHR